MFCKKSVDDEYAAVAVILAIANQHIATLAELDVNPLMIREERSMF
tara:strand:+ start:21858 stop:21995 length:138 start_codon:yes stop_codon:yes gene_type:complete